jgi:probable rRNA maturation factor
MRIDIDVIAGGGADAAAASITAHDGPLVRAVQATLRDRAVTDAEISLTLLGDAEIQALNQRYLGHDGPTDVLSFPLYEPGEPPVGDIYIGYAQALRQAEALGVPESEELARLAVHGTLHVLGYDHPEGEDRESSEMWRLQEEILARLR